MPTDPPTWAEAWAASGAMALTGRSDGPPLVAPDGVVERIAGLGHRLHVDALALLGERAAIEGLTRAGGRSCGGSARFVRCADGWLVVQLARDEDRVAVPAWLGLDHPPTDDDLWPVIEQRAAHRSARDLVEQAGLLGLPFARVDEVAPPDGSDDLDGLPVRARSFPTARTLPIGGTTPARRASADEPLVVDLSSLWAGPLAARLLADRGARVVKVESTSRPDGARRGPVAFFDRLHHGTRSVGLALDRPEGQATLRRLVERADIVIEGSRPRALRSMGVEVAHVMADGRPRVWVSITGFGRDVDRVAFGDGAAAAGGLVAFDDDGPCFVADAIADPLAGMTAAAAVEAGLAAGGSWLVDVSMAGVAAHVAGADRGRRWRPDARLTAAPPRAPVAPATAPDLGTHDDEVGAELGIEPR